ncbi:MAG: outer membrane protein transport protein [Bdellovibrionaceae bacterium]|nr:outer membrane protein transport protein [Pseudobdellovibrionaceae bacterium]
MRYQSAETMGTAFASDVTGSKTASGFYNNPSQLMFLEDGIHGSVELMGLFPMGDFENTGGGADTDGFASASFIPSLYYGQKFADKMGVVVSFTVPWATNTEYDRGWAGETHALKTYLATYNLSPSFVYEVSEQLALSVGPQIQFIKGELSQATVLAAPPAPTALTGMDGDHLGFGFTLSALYKASDALRIGFNYKSRIKHTIEGKLSMDPNPIGLDGNNVELELSTPDVITVGASYLLQEKLDLHGSVSWSSWSVFDQLAVENTTTPAASPAPVETKWDDTFFVAFGADYYFSDQWTFRGGLSYETGAPPDKYRTPRSVDSDRVTLGLGASYALSESMTINGALTQLFYASAPTVDLPAAPPTHLAPLEGEYKGNMATAVRVGVSARF